MTPLFSIIIPTFNGQETILLVLESIKNQSFQNFEVIIYDDASNDETKSFIKDWINNFNGKVRLVEGKENKGSFYGANECIKLAEGDFIVTGAQDNIFSYNRLSLISKTIQSNPSLCFITSDVFTGTIRQFLAGKGDVKQGLSRLIKPNLFFLMLLRSVFFQFDNLIVRKDVAALFQKSSKYSPCEDFYFVLNAFLINGVNAQNTLHIKSSLLYKINLSSSQTFYNAQPIRDVTMKIGRKFSDNYFLIRAIEGSSNIILFMRSRNYLFLIKYLFKNPIKFFLGFLIIIIRILIQFFLTKRNQSLGQNFLIRS